ncbi:MAG TPA: tol-pal system protein YbgF [Mesorhizobium sp.]|jgi:tol-pal system protein YbgF|nr:tol-pal system protein YbgF [Mesorhizobium sp.]
MRHTVPGALALALLASPLAAPAWADDRSGFRLPGVLEDIWPGRERESAQKRAAEQPAVQYAQAGDPRITELQEQIRRLSGTVEELNFQILQMQEQMRKQQEDIEFRFQEIEGGGGGNTNSGAKTNTQGSLIPPASTAAATAQAPAAGEPMGAAGDVPVGASQAQGAPAGDAAPTNAASVGMFGSITFDASGNVTGGSVGDQAVISRGAEAPADAGTDGTVVAALPATDNPDELYGSAYEFILAGDYATAEAGFRAHAERFPEDTRAADTQFWLGEALLAQNKSRDAAEVFLAANKAWPDAKKAPDMLFKLGVSLKRLNQGDVACATFKEVEKRYPEKLSKGLTQRLAAEKAAC